MIRQAVIIAGGLGTRLGNYKQNLPKCLNTVGTRSLIEQTLEILSKSEIKLVHLLLGNLANLIIDEINLLERKFKLQITYSVEEIQLGTGGCLISNLMKLEDEFLVIYGDLYVDTDLGGIVNVFDKHSADFAQFVHPTNHMHDSDIVKVSDEMHILGYELKPRQKFVEIRNLANSGVYAFKKSSLQEFKEQFGNIDLDRVLLPLMINEGKKGIAVRNFGYIRDAGTKERIISIEMDILAGLTMKRRKPAIFFDRDGTLNKNRGYISSGKDIELFDDVPDSIRALNKLGYWVIVITNQPVIARGEATFEDIDRVHARIDAILSKNGAFIDEYFVCPHHPIAGFEGEIEYLKITCGCRKPRTGLLEKAFYSFPIDKTNSIFIGNEPSDMLAAKNFGIKGVLIRRSEEILSNVFTEEETNDSIWSLSEIVQMCSNKLT